MFEGKKSILLHFIGIGGESMSSLAQYAFSAGFCVTGSDRTGNRNVERLRKLGIKIAVPHDERIIDGCDFAVISLAVEKDNVEFLRAKEFGIPILSRSEFLGLVAKRHKKCVAVAGSHGKSTTSAMTGQILIDGGLDPAIHIGCDFPYIGGNSRFSTGEYFVTEACEYKKSFLSLRPYIATITNIELDHPDYYKSEGELFAAFSELSKRTSGAVIAGIDDVKKLGIKNALTAGFERKCDYGAIKLKNSDGRFSFVFKAKGKEVGEIKLKKLGLFNVKNALFALATADVLGVPFDVSKSSLEKFGGVLRRQEVLCDGKFKIITDYSHHPTQIKNIAECYKSDKGSLIGVFQPHTYSRTRALISEFSECFSDFDKIFFLPTYAARENFDEKGCAERLFFETKNPNKKMTDEKSVCKELPNVAKEGDTIIFMGAGTIDKIARDFAKTIE